MEQDSVRQTTMDGIDGGGLHSAVDGQRLSEKCKTGVVNFVKVYNSICAIVKANTAVNLP